MHAGSSSDSGAGYSSALVLASIRCPVAVITIDVAFARLLPSLARLPSTVIWSSIFS
jgi:hypothetical protein